MRDATAGDEADRPVGKQRARSGRGFAQALKCHARRCRGHLTLGSGWLECGCCGSVYHTERGPAVSTCAPGFLAEVGTWKLLNTELVQP